MDLTSDTRKRPPVKAVVEGEPDPRVLSEAIQFLLRPKAGDGGGRAAESKADTSRKTA